MPRRIAMFAYPGVQMLDVIGPLEVFARTSRALREYAGHTSDAYTVEIIGLARGAFRASSGLRLYADHGFRHAGKGIDTLLVAGGITTDTYVARPDIVRWIRAQASRVRRLAAVCTGAFFLAEAGLLDGLRVTTHWASCVDLARRYPRLRVEPDRLYVKEGAIYTTAGVTAGIDLALALVEEDFGREVALGIARALVMFLKRPGGQAQFSAQLAQQLAEREPLRDLQAYILEHPRADLSVEALARRVGMSPRNFARVFTTEIGTTPARFVTAARVEAARRMLEDSPARRRVGLEEVCVAVGLGTPESMRRAFMRTVGVPPSAYRERFNPPAAARKRPRRVA